MVKFWQIRAGRRGAYWDAWKEKGIITIGWNVDEDIVNLSKEELKELIGEKYDGDPGKIAGMLRTFAGKRQDDKKNMKEGDKVVVLGSADVRSVAEIGDYRYEPEEDLKDVYWRDVDYIYDGNPVRFRDLPPEFRPGGDKSLHLPQTLQRFWVDEESINELLRALRETHGIPPEEASLIDNEMELQDYIEDNYKDLNEDISEIHREKFTSVGNVDFYCIKEDGTGLAIETKVGQATDSAIGQLLGYMNDLRESEDREIEGLLIAESFSQRVIKAASLTDIKLRRFKTRLEFPEIR